MDKQAQSRLDPTRIIALSTAYWESQTLLTANRMGLFALLGSEAKSLESISSDLGASQSATRLFLNACVAMQLVARENGCYSNTELSRAFLVPGGPAYLGDALRYSDDLYATWGALETVLRSGTPAKAAETYTGADPEETRHFVYGMHNRALGIASMLVEMIDLDGKQRMIDVGGGPGTYSALLARRYPRLHSQVLDLPAVAGIAAEIIDSMGVADRVRARAMDYSRDEFPAGNDVVLISGVFHRESEATCKSLIQRAWHALEPGGMLVVSDVFTDAGGTSPLFATLFGLNMMLTAQNGTVHADDDVADWLRDQRFGEISKAPFPGPLPHRVVTGVKLDAIP